MVWADVGGALVELDLWNQVRFTMQLDDAVRDYVVEGRELQERYFVPDGLQAFVMTLQGAQTFVVEPEFDMRYYQAFATDFSQYGAEEVPQGLFVSNCVENVGAAHATMQFYGLVGAADGSQAITMLPEDQRLVNQIYLKDEKREKLIISVYKETHARGPDEAPIWDTYSTKVYKPVRIRLQGPVTVICAFGDRREEVVNGFSRLQRDLPAYRSRKRETIIRELDQGRFETGIHEVDTAYAQVSARFNQALVARDAILHVDPIHVEHYYAIFAGNKYFMDAWKRDENISLGALLATNDYETVREILDDTWQHQDERTGRLPHIIRAGEPLVYYSSDGTLWALQRLFEYTRQSGDETLLGQKMPMVERFFEASMTFIQRGLLPSGGIIDKDYLWETWEDTPFTPRAGYPVEIELLWLTVLRELLPYVRRQHDDLADQMAEALEQGDQTFQQFIHDGYLVDSLSYQWEQQQILTPNGYIAFGLDYPLPVELERSMVALGRDQLAGHRGVRSLAPRDWPKVLPAAFLDDPKNHRGNDMASVGIFNYHRGIEWEWLNPFFVQGELMCGSAQEAYSRYVQGQATEALKEVGIGGLSELYDLHGQVGADFQAWSMAGFIQSLHLFAGVQVDACEKAVRICPAIPPEWPHLRCRRRVGNAYFDLHCEQPSASSRRLEVRLLQEPPSGYELSLGIRLPPRSRIAATTRNGSAVPSDAWSYKEGCDPEREGTAWIVYPFERTVALEVEISPTSS